MKDLETMICNGVQVAKSQQRQSVADFAISLKRMNSRLLDYFTGSEGAHSISCDKELPLLYTQYTWLLPCCADATEISDMYNECHVTGMVFCKHVFAFFFREQDDSYKVVDAQNLFGHVDELHLTNTPIAMMSVDELMLFVSSVQYYWERVVNSDRTAEALLLMACRMGEMLIFNIPAEKNPERHHVEDITQREGYVRIKKKTIRTFVCTLLVMLRGIAIAHCATTITSSALEREEKEMCVNDNVYSQKMQEECGICNEIHRCILKVKSARQCGQQQQKQKTMDGESLWKFVASRMPEEALGMPPRKIDSDLQGLLRDACVFQDAATSYFNQHVVLNECANCLQAALMFFYITPSTETFKRLSLLSDVRPGQRLSYCFDYVHFDTGQISQIVYLHNPTYRQSRPPVTVADWNNADVSGPVAAFMQLDPTLQICFDDSEDPLGLLGHERQILRPSDHALARDNKDDTTPRLPRYVFLMNRAGLYLVDRETTQIFTSGVSAIHSQRHPVLYLLCMYVFLRNQVQEVCKVAINSYKVFKNDSTSSSL